MKAANDDEPQLLSLVAHEVSSPASVVAGYIRFLLKGNAGDLSESQRKMLEEASRSCARILDLMRELKDLAALRSADATVELRPVAIFDLCDEVLRATVKGGTFTCSLADKAAVVEGDAVRLRRALVSFVAAQQRERGEDGLQGYGFVARAGGAPRAVIVLGGEEIMTRRDVAVVEDAGTFERWRGGLGMALPIACEIVEAHGGRVWSVAGDPCRGTALSLPLAQAA